MAAPIELAPGRKTRRAVFTNLTGTASYPLDGVGAVTTTAASSELAGGGAAIPVRLTVLVVPGADVSVTVVDLTGATVLTLTVSGTPAGERVFEFECPIDNGIGINFNGTMSLLLEYVKVR